MHHDRGRSPPNDLLGGRTNQPLVCWSIVSPMLEKCAFVFFEGSFVCLGIFAEPFIKAGVVGRVQMVGNEGFIKACGGGRIVGYPIFFSKRTNFFID